MKGNLINVETKILMRKKKEVNVPTINYFADLKFFLHFLQIPGCFEAVIVIGLRRTHVLIILLSLMQGILIDYKEKLFLYN